MMAGHNYLIAGDLNIARQRNCQGSVNLSYVFCDVAECAKVCLVWGGLNSDFGFDFSFGRPGWGKLLYNFRFNPCTGAISFRFNHYGPD